MLEPRGIKVQFDLPPAPVSPGDEERTFTLFRCVRELFANVVKHSRAQVVVVRASQENGHLQIVIQDDGIGLDTRSIVQLDGTNRFGLFNVREQLNSIGGALDLESEPGRFTRAKLSVPGNSIAAAADRSNASGSLGKQHGQDSNSDRG